MTMQVDQSVAATPGTTPRRWSRAVVAVVAASLLAATGVAIGLEVSGGPTAATEPPKPVLGDAREPLAVYMVVSRLATQRVGTGEMRVQGLGKPGYTTILRSAPAVTLHVQYAHVRPVVGHWQISFIAPEGDTFNLDSTQGHSYEAVIGGKSTFLFFVRGSADGTNFSIGGGATLTDGPPAT